jgi:hypothetical protein
MHVGDARDTGLSQHYLRDIWSRTHYCLCVPRNEGSVLPTCGSLSMICHLALSPMACAAVAESFSSISTVRSTRLPLPMVLVQGRERGA